MYFVDVGTADTLSNDTFADNEAKAQHDLYRLNGKILMQFINTSREGAAVIVSLDELCCNEGGEIVLAATGAVITRLHKLCSWATVFRLCERNPHASQIFIASQVRGRAQFFPPLYTHIVGQRTFVMDLKRAYELQDESQLNEGQLELKAYLPSAPEEVDDEALPCFTSDNMHPFQVKVRALSVGGYWSASVFLIHRPERDGPHEWIPAGYRYLLEEHTFEHLEQDDEV